HLPAGGAGLRRGLTRVTLPSGRADSVDRATGRLPRVVRRARTERARVLRDARIAPDFLRACGVSEEIRIVLHFPHEDEVRSGHEVGNKCAPLRGTRKRVRLDAEPPAVVGAVILRPQLLVGEELLIEKARPPGLKATLLHSEKLAARGAATSGMLGVGSG